MKRAIAHDSEVANLVWREKSAGGWVPVFRSFVNGRDKWETLKGVVVFSEGDKREVRKLIREKRAAIGLAGLRERLSDAGAKVLELSEVADLVAAYDAYWQGTRKEDDTRRACVAAFRAVIRIGAGADDSASLAVWSRDTIMAYEAAKVKQVRAKAVAEKWDAEKASAKMTSAMRSVWGVFRQAKSLFSEASMASVHYRALALPGDLDDTLSLRPGDQSMPQYVRPAAEVVQRVIEGVRELRVVDPEMYLAAALEILTGARVGSAIEAKWAWFIDQGMVDMQSGRAVVVFSIQIAKGTLSSVQIFKEDYDLLLAVRGEDTREYVVPGATADDRRAVFDRLLVWLRAQGLDRRQPNHELRKLFGDTMSKRHGVSAAAGALGHSDEKLTKKHYAERGISAPISMSDVLSPRRAG